MPGPGRVEQVARQHRVEPQSAQRDAVARQDDRLELQVVADLADRLVLEQRAQAVERHRHVELRSRRRPRQQVLHTVAVVVSERHVA
ncbi:hypothetical protein D3C83_15320 [compost metagenome]